MAWFSTAWQMPICKVYIRLSQTELFPQSKHYQEPPKRKLEQFNWPHVKYRNLGVKSSSLFPLQMNHWFLSADNLFEVISQSQPSRNGQPVSCACPQLLLQTLLLPLVPLHSLLTPYSSCTMPGVPGQIHTFFLAKGSSWGSGTEPSSSQTQLINSCLQYPLFWSIH